MGGEGGGGKGGWGMGGRVEGWKGGLCLWRNTRGHFAGSKGGDMSGALGGGEKEGGEGGSWPADEYAGWHWGGGKKRWGEERVRRAGKGR